MFRVALDLIVFVVGAFGWQIYQVVENIFKKIKSVRTDVFKTA